MCGDGTLSSDKDTHCVSSKQVKVLEAIWPHGFQASSSSRKLQASKANSGSQGRRVDSLFHWLHLFLVSCPRPSHPEDLPLLLHPGEQPRKASPK